MAKEKKVRTPQAERISLLRKQLGVKQAEFADRLKVDQTTVSNWETGKAKPGPHTYMQLVELATGDLRRQLAEDGGLGLRRERVFASDGYTDAGRVYHDLTGIQREVPFKISLNAAEEKQMGGISAASTVSSWDPDLLIEVIEIVNSEAQKKGCKLPIRKFASIVASVYERYQKTGSREPGVVGEYLRIA